MAQYSEEVMIKGNTSPLSSPVALRVSGWSLPKSASESHSTCAYLITLHCNYLFLFLFLFKQWTLWGQMAPAFCSSQQECYAHVYIYLLSEWTNKWGCKMLKPSGRMNHEWWFTQRFTFWSNALLTPWDRRIFFKKGSFLDTSNGVITDL